MISEKLTEDMKAAMKAGDKTRLSVVRMLLSELQNARIAAGDSLSEADEEKVVAGYAKKRKETMDKYIELDRKDAADKEELEYNITLSYLPPKLDEAELTRIIKAAVLETGAEGPKDFGRVMKSAMEQVGSRSDGAAVSALVKKVLGG